MSVLSLQAVGDGKNVKIASFGSFEKYVARPRSATNFQSKERIQVPSKNRIRFKPYKSFKKIVETSNPTTSKGPETKFGDGES